MILQVLLALLVLGLPLAAAALPLVDTAVVPLSGWRLGYPTDNGLKQTFVSPAPFQSLDLCLARRGTPGALRVDVGSASVTVTPAIASLDWKKPTCVKVGFPAQLPAGGYTLTLSTVVIDAANHYWWPTSYRNPYPGGYFSRPASTLDFRYDAMLRVFAEPGPVPPVIPPPPVPPDPTLPPGTPPPPPGPIVEPPMPPIEAGPYGGVGYGAAARGGFGMPVVWVTTLDNDGPGSLREAVSAGDREIRFSVAGTLRNTGDEIKVRGQNITIDFDSAPAPGIIVEGPGLLANRRNGADHLVVLGYRGRGAPGDCGSFQSVSNVLIDRASCLGWSDGGIDITEWKGGPTRNITVQRSLVGRAWGDPNLHDLCMLIKYGAHHVTLYRNAILNCSARNPQYRAAHLSPMPIPPWAGLQMTNNFVWYRDQGATMVGDVLFPCPQCIKANIIGNVFEPVPGSKAELNRGIAIDKRLGTNIYAEGNVTPAPPEPTPTALVRHPEPPVPTVDACVAAREILTDVGPRHPDPTGVEQDLLARIVLTGCP